MNLLIFAALSADDELQRERKQPAPSDKAKGKTVPSNNAQLLQGEQIKDNSTQIREHN